MEELKRFRDYYNQSFWAWFFPKNLSYALMYAGGYFNKHESQLQCAHLVCNHFELAYGKMGSFGKWFFKRQFDDFKNSELYQKYLLIPIQERCTRKETDFNMYDLSVRAPLFPLLQSISGTDTATALENAKKVLSLVAPLQKYGYSKHLAVYGIAQHTENEDILYQKFPLISLNQDYSNININLDTPVPPSAEVFNTALAQLIRLVSSNHGPMILNITLPSIVKNHDLSSFEQAVAVKNQNEKCSIQYSITAEKTKPVVPEKTWNEPFAWLRTIYPIYRDQQKQTLSDQLIALVQEPKDNQELIISLLNDKKQELATADLKHLLYFAAQEGKIKVVQALTSLDGDLTLNHKILWYGLRSAVASKQFYCVDHFFNMASEKKYLLTQKEVDTLLQSITSAGFVANIKLDWPLAIHIMERAHPLALLSEETLQDITIRAKDQGVYDTLPECFKEPYSPNEPPHFKCG